MLQRTARIPLWMALAMMAPLAVGVIVAAGVPFDACGHGRMARGADRDGVVALLAARHASTHVRLRMIRVLCHPI